jgi:hypothetical protein
MITLFLLATILSATGVGDPGGAGENPAADSCELGGDRLVFFEPAAAVETNPYARELVTAHGRDAGRPFRSDVSVACLSKGSNTGFIGSSALATNIDLRTIGRFLGRIESPEDAANVIRTLGHPERKYWLSAEQLRGVLRAVSAAGAGYGFAAVEAKPEPDHALIERGCFSSGGIWLADFVATEEVDWVVEYKYAIDGRNRVARVRKVILAGTPPAKPIPDGLGLAPPVHEPRPGDLAAQATRRACIAANRAHQLLKRREAVISAAAFLPMWASSLRAPDPEVRRAAAEQIQFLDVLARDVTPNVPDPLGDDGSMARWAAAAARTGLGEKVIAVIPQLAAALGDNDDGVRVAAMHAIVAMGPAAVPQLKSVEQSGGAVARAQAAAALREIARDAVGRVVH